MKFETTPAFDGDVRRLKRRPDDYQQFRTLVREQFIPAAVRQVERPGERWPARLRVRDITGARGVLEMTWAWPDGRATFEWVEIEGETGIRWRRVGGHGIFRDP